MQSKKPKVMLHIIMPNQISGPNTSAKLIGSSWLVDKYEFCYLQQTYLAGGNINFKLIRDLYNQIIRENPDIIHISGLQSSGFHATIAAKLAGCKHIILTVRGFAGDAMKLPLIYRLAFNMIIEPLTLRLSDYVYTVCAHAARQKMIRYNVRTLHDSIYNAAPHPLVTIENSLRQELNLNSDDLIVSTASRVIEDKGYKHLAEAILKLVEMDKRLKFVIIGDGNWLPNLRLILDKYLDTQVFLLGQRNNVLELLYDSDIFVFPTLHENLSNVLLEACVAKNAIIATNVGGNPEVICNNETGTLIPPANSDAIVQAVIKYANDPKTRKKMAENAYQLATNKFSQNNIYKKINELYSKALGD